MHLNALHGTIVKFDHLLKVEVSDNVNNVMKFELFAMTILITKL